MLEKLLRRFRTPADHPPGYTVLGTIREGSMSVISRARHEETGRVVALKIHKPEARQHVDHLETHYRDFTEGQVTSAFDHPNVVRCLDHGDLGGGRPYLVLELLDGMTLHGLRGGESERFRGKRQHLARQAAAGLAHIHSRGFIHHDFCCKNLFVTTDDAVKVIDFGLAVPMVDHPIVRSRMGTCEILAPELLRHEPSDHRIDVFGWGVVAYELLTGHWPFESPEHHQTLNKILNIKPVPLRQRNPDVSDEVSKLVMRCLAKNPSKRLTSMKTAAGVLQRHSDDGV